MNRFEFKTFHARDLVEAFREDGYAIVENVISEQGLTGLTQEIDPWLEGTAENNPEGFLGQHTKRFGRLVYRIPSTHDLIMHPMSIHVCEETIGKYACAFRLSFTGVMHVMEGQKPQALHRDVTPFPPPAPTMIVASMWSVSDFTKENGATVLVPGSHKWPQDRVPQPTDLVHAEMKAGSVLYYDGSLLHGAGKCTKGERTGVNLQYKVGWLRQDENQYLATPLEYARELPEDLQRVIGYDLAARHWGSVGQEHPLDFLNDREIVGTLEPPGYDYEDRVIEIEAKELGLAKPRRYYVTSDD